jgi:hypothetical protein
MSGFPPGKWPPLLVGHVWPYDTALASINAGKTNRGNIETGYNNFTDQLRNARFGPLSQQEGVTADDIRDAYYRGEQDARQVAQKNGVKKSSCATDYDSAESLQQELYELAVQGNSEIEQIENSGEPTETKVGKIVGKVADYQRQANSKATNCIGNIMDAIQRVLDEEGTGQSAREFAQAHGVDLRQLSPQPDQKGIEAHVQGMLNTPGSTTGFAESPNNTSGPPQAPPEPAPAAPGSSLGFAQTPGNGQGPPPASPEPAPAAPGSSLGFAQSPVNPPRVASGPAPTPPVAGSPPAISPSLPSTPTSSLPGAPSLPSAPSAAGVASLPGAPSAPTLGPAQGLTPANLLQDFDKGLQAGAPLSAAANALPQPPMEAQPPQAPPSAPTTPMAGAGVPVHAPVLETPPVEHAPAPPAPVALPIMTGPTAPSGPVAPSASLPAYGADMRPPAPAVSTPSVPTPSPPPSMTPSSAPVHPSTGQSGVGQPAVVRQPAPQSQPPPPSSIGTQTVGATAGGALAGAASAEATARERLQRIVDAVARQEPRLAWAAGDRPDGTTVLVTDLANGWIPPGINIPAAVALLEPACRRGDLESLLGAVNVTASYIPIHQVPDNDEPVRFSTRPRRAPEIDDFGYRSRGT